MYGAKALIAKQNFHSCTIFDENMVLIEFNQLKADFNKPIYTGFTILDLSKIMIYDFHYNYMKHNFGNNAYDIPLANKKVLGLMKNENNGKIMLEFIGLPLKLYAFKVQGIKK